MSLSESPRQQALRELQSETCAVCARGKEPKQSFCRPCYFKLPQPMRQTLYQSFGSGYEESYSEAKDWLIQERKVQEG